MKNSACLGSCSHSTDLLMLFGLGKTASKSKHIFWKLCKRCLPQLLFFQLLHGSRIQLGSSEPSLPQDSDSDLGLRAVGFSMFLSLWQGLVRLVQGENLLTSRLWQMSLPARSGDGKSTYEEVAEQSRNSCQLTCKKKIKCPRKPLKRAHAKLQQTTRRVDGWGLPESQGRLD